MKFINFFFLCLWVIFALSDPDPGTPLNPDTIVVVFGSTTLKRLEHDSPSVVEPGLADWPAVSRSLWLSSASWRLLACSALSSVPAPSRSRLSASTRLAFRPSSRSNLRQKISVRGDIVTELLCPQLHPRLLQVPPQRLHQASLQAQLPLQSETEDFSERGYRIRAGNRKSKNFTGGIMFFWYFLVHTFIPSHAYNTFIRHHLPRFLSISSLATINKWCPTTDMGDSRQLTTRNNSDEWHLLTWAIFFRSEHQRTTQNVDRQSTTDTL